MDPLLPENSSAFIGENVPSLPDEFKNCSTALDVFAHLNVFFNRLMVFAVAVSESYASLTFWNILSASSLRCLLFGRSGWYSMANL